MVKRVLKIFIVIIIVIVLFVFLSILSFRIARRGDFRRQEKHLVELQDSDAPFLEIWDRNLDDSIPINEIRYLATHNSYRIQAGALQFFFLNLGEPGGSAALKYSHLPFTDQFNLGVRSLELDLRFRRGMFENCHVPLVDNRSHSPAVIPTLQELRLWSDRHPAHVPIIILMEVKNDWSFLDPSLDDWSSRALVELDTLIAEELSGKLLSPRDLKADFPTVKGAIEDSGWPGLAEVRGKFLFVHHEGDARLFSQDYIDSDNRISFMMGSLESPEASFFLRNDPFDGEIAELVESGYIVRTRADSDCQVSEEQKNAAINSGAQIVSTDFPEGYVGTDERSLSWDSLMKIGE